MPTIDATAISVPSRLRARMRNPAIDAFLSLGTNGETILYPFWGSVKRFRKNSVRSVRENLYVLVWAGLLGTAATGALIALLLAGYQLPSGWKLLALASVAAVAERQSVRVSSNVEMTISFLPFVFTAVAFGPLAAFAVGALANVTVFQRPYLRWAVYTPARALTGVVTGLAASAVASTHEHAFGVLAVATVVAGLVNLSADIVLNTTTLFTRRSPAPFAFVTAAGPLLVLSLPLYVPIVALMAYGYRNYSFVAAATFLIPALALQRLVHLYQDQREATRGLADANRRLEQANLSFATALVTTLDARDRYTAGHSAAVAVYARDIAERLGLADDKQRLAHVCGLVHDVGKIGLPPGLLEKPGPLTLEERRQMEAHTVIGERILGKVEDYSEIATIVRHHHERVDGAGYPDGLLRDQIPLLSLIIAVADAYNAMTSDRPYRDAMPSRVARLRLAQAVETQFDTTVVAAFEAILAGATETYRLGDRGDFDLSRQETLTEALRPATRRLSAAAS